MRLTTAQREQITREIEERWETIADHCEDARMELELIRTLKACLRQDDLFELRLVVDDTQSRGEQCTLRLIHGAARQSK